MEAGQTNMEDVTRTEDNTNSSYHKEEPHMEVVWVWQIWWWSDNFVHAADQKSNTGSERRHVDWRELSSSSSCCSCWAERCSSVLHRDWTYISWTHVSTERLLKVWTRVGCSVSDVFSVDITFTGSTTDRLWLRSTNKRRSLISQICNLTSCVLNKSVRVFIVSEQLVSLPLKVLFPTRDIMSDFFWGNFWWNMSSTLRCVDHEHDALVNRSL